MSIEEPNKTSQTDPEYTQDIVQRLRDITDPQGFVDDDDGEPSLEDEYEDLVEDIMLYPQNYSTEQIEMVGLTLDDVYPKTETEDIDDE